MSSFIRSLIDQKMREAAQDGTLERLPGFGKPLDLSRDPYEAMLDRMHKAARTKPKAVTLKDQMAESTARLAGLTEPEARRAEMKVLADLQTRLAIEMESLRRSR